MSRRSTVAQSKDAERRVARLYPNARRLSAGEWNGRGDVDVVTPDNVIQVKHRKNVPAYILEGLDQIQEGAKDVQEVIRLQGESMYARKPLLVIVTKPGSGRPSRIFEVKEVFEKDE